MSHKYLVKQPENKMKTFLILFLALMVNLSFAQKKAPNFKLDDIEGNKVELKSFAGKGPILISFWATWCKPCVEEMIEYNKLYKEYKEKGFTIIAISIDDEKTVARVKPHVKSKGYSFPVLLDSNSEAARKYYVQGSVPYSILLNKNLEIVYKHEGYVKGDEIHVKNKIEELLK